MRKNKWNSDSCEREALKYKSRADFKRGSGSAYKAARKLGIIDKICSHMENMAGVRTMTNDQLIFVSKTFNNIKDLNNNNRGIYRAILNRGLEKVAFEHMENGGYTCYPWTDEELRQEALKYEYRGDFQKYGNDAYQVAIKRGILGEICIHMEAKYEYWDYNKLKEEALKYETRVKFQKENGSAYLAALTMEILDEICSHMRWICYPWTDEELRQEALKYEYRADFMKYGSKAYYVAARRSMLDDICKHMKPSLTSSLPEREIFDAVKSLFPSTTKLRDRKITIEGKPYMYGFDIDIFVPELMLGIEYDGGRSHSFEYMREDIYKAKWSDDDIRNYHEIKDAWFLTKGIKIIHIKEVDWKKDSDKCVKKCLEFLGV